MKSRLLGGVLYLLIAGALCVVVLEVALRLYHGVTVFTVRDWRTLQAALLQTSGATYDHLLGWTQVPNFVGGGFNTLAHGIRKNSDEDEELTSGAILAVGNSYTAGSEVVDEDTWPAQLERMLRKRVINAGVGGYGVDQSVLNAERLIPMLKPRAVIIGIYQEDIQRVAYANYNAPKPYFVEEDGKWRHRNNPVPRAIRSDAEPLYKTVLARFLSAHLVLQRFRDWWYSGNGPVYRRVQATPSRTSCYLLQRLIQQLAVNDAKGYVVFQYTGWAYARQLQRPPYVQQVIDCSRSLGYEVIDEFEHVAQIASRSHDTLRQYYVMSPDGAFGHMSAKGNGLIASLIADRLRSSVELDLVAALPQAAPEPDDGKGINRILTAHPDRHLRANIAITVVPAGGPLPGEPVVRLTATGTGEHYLTVLWSGRRPGPYTFSVYVRDSTLVNVRLHVHDRIGNGGIADFSFGNRTVKSLTAGTAKVLAAAMRPLTDGWSRLYLSTELAGSKGSALVQIIGLSPDGTDPQPPLQLTIQGPMVEQGTRVSPYCRRGACLAAKPTQP
jgi:hypothetical protein